MMYSSQLSAIRARGEYSPRWLLVPLACIAMLLAGWFMVVELGSVDDATPVFVDSIDTTPIEQHGA